MKKRPKRGRSTPAAAPAQATTAVALRASSTSNTKYWLDGQPPPAWLAEVEREEAEERVHPRGSLSQEEFLRQEEAASPWRDLGQARPGTNDAPVRALVPTGEAAAVKAVRRPRSSSNKIPRHESAKAAPAKATGLSPDSPGKLDLEWPSHDRDEPEANAARAAIMMQQSATCGANLRLGKEPNVYVPSNIVPSGSGASAKSEAAPSVRMARGGTFLPESTRASPESGASAQSEAAPTFVSPVGRERRARAAGKRRAQKETKKRLEEFGF